jgi:hypothetical protein
VDNIDDSQGCSPSTPQAALGNVDAMAVYEVTLKDRTVEVIDGADAYQQEGQMTTFFLTASDREVVDCWSKRLASFRTSEILIVRRVAALVGQGT